MRDADVVGVEPRQHLSASLLLVRRAFHDKKVEVLEQGEVYRSVSDQFQEGGALQDVAKRQTQTLTFKYLHEKEVSMSR